MDNEVSMVFQLSHDLLKRFSIDMPTVEQLETASSFISKVICEGQFVFDYKLSRKEALCLYWSAQGKSSLETAKILHLSNSTVKTYKNRIMKKLNCKNIAHAVYQGMKYAYICPNINGGLNNLEKATFWSTILPQE